ncbi:MAG: ABC transporter ATP-binding protein [Deltaproteobacteria bacterium]|nr:ABC transporter ATP-binding protein [Deltaproteobacteria bacterium]
MDFLTISNLSKSYGGVSANSDISLSIEKGEIVSIIGPNGAGKTTLFDLITGVTRADSGSVKFQGAEMNHMHTSDIAKLGVVRTFQQTKIFRDLTVLEAVMIGNHLHDHTSLWQSFLATRAACEQREKKREHALEILEFMGMADKKDLITQNLPYGEQKLLNIAIALAVKPNLLLLDEPAAGMNPMESMRMLGTIRKIQETGITVGLVEHNMRLVMNISERIFVLDYGELIAEGKPEEIRANSKVIEVYLGRQASA